jgi:hypothetical protein
MFYVVLTVYCHDASFVVFLLLSFSALFLARHVTSSTSIPPPCYNFSSLAWDAASHHLVAEFSVGPTVYGIPDYGVARCLISQPPSNSSGVSVAGVADDHLRHRLKLSLYSYFVSLILNGYYIYFVTFWKKSRIRLSLALILIF